MTERGRAFCDVSRSNIITREGAAQFEAMKDKLIREFEETHQQSDKKWRYHGNSQTITEPVPVDWPMPLPHRVKTS